MTLNQLRYFGKGRNGDIVVAVTLDDNAVITNIEVKEQQETEGVGDIAFDPMISQMVEHNSVIRAWYSGSSVVADRAASTSLQLSAVMVSCF